MKRAQIERQRRIRQRNLDRVTCINLICHIVICIIIALIAIYCAAEKYEDNFVEVSESCHESYEQQCTSLISIETKFSELESKETETKKEVSTYPKFTYSKDWSQHDSYLLAKIAMAEAEGCNIQTKTLVIMTVLNRVWSDEFPDSIEEVIFQNRNGVYQFSPVSNGRWDRVEPNEDCYEAVRIVMKSVYDYSGGALYFESCEDEDNWHSRNLEFLYESEGLRFYK